MPTVKVSKKAKGRPDAVYKKLKQYCKNKLVLKELGNFQARLAWKDKKRSGSFDEKGVTGTIAVSSRSPCQITITVELPFLLTPFKKIVKNSIRKHLGHIV